MRALLLFTVLAILFSQWLIFFFAPEEKTLGIVQKIFYLHMPLAWWSFVGFFGVFLYSILYLIKKNERYFLLAGAYGEIGVLFSTLMILTGMLWARSSWNTWWTWDPRLTTAFIMWFSYVIYLVLRNSQDQKSKIISSCLGIVAFLDIPLVFMAARLWRSIHPAVFSAKGGLEPKMKLVLLISFIAWGLMFGTLLIMRNQTLKLTHLRRKLLFEEPFLRK